MRCVWVSSFAAALWVRQSYACVDAAPELRRLAPSVTQRAHNTMIIPRRSSPRCSQRGARLPINCKHTQIVSCTCGRVSITLKQGFDCEPRANLDLAVGIVLRAREEADGFVRRSDSAPGPHPQVLRASVYQVLIGCSVSSTCMLLPSSR